LRVRCLLRRNRADLIAVKIKARRTIKAGAQVALTACIIA
jgi:hypothetical protein